jgi:hypothetical protein
MLTEMAYRKHGHAANLPSIANLHQHYRYCNQNHAIKLKSSDHSMEFPTIDDQAISQDVPTGRIATHDKSSGDFRYNPSRMGQFALGLRSLLIKSAVFVVMAALLAWALGGTLWPRAQIARTAEVYFAGHRWHWQLAVGGKTPGEARWRLMISDASGKTAPFDDDEWGEVAGPIAGDDGLYVAHRPPHAKSGWVIERINEKFEGTPFPMPDRLAVEQQLVRIYAGLPIQDEQTILKHRPFVLDPPG